MSKTLKDFLNLKVESLSVVLNTICIGLVTWQAYSDSAIYLLFCAPFVVGILIILVGDVPLKRLMVFNVIIPVALIYFYWDGIANNTLEFSSLKSLLRDFSALVVFCAAVLNVYLYIELQREVDRSSKAGNPFA